MRSLVKELEHGIEEADDGTTPAHDDDPALVGGQDELPDALQRAIIKKKTGKSPQRENRAIKITKGQLRRIIKEKKARLFEGQLMYHSTDPKNVGSIQQDGLTVGRESAQTLGGAWADEFYGTRPIYLSVEKGKYAGTPLAVDTSGLALVADLPSLVDAGAYQEEEGMYWDEGSEPAQMIDIVDEDGMVYFDDLLSPGSAAAEAAIEITGTAAVLDNIPPKRIQLTERRHMKITKGQLRRIIRESFGYRNISDEYYWRNPYPFYWFCEAEFSGWTYYAVVMEDWQGDFYWSVHEKKGRLPGRMSEKTARSLMKRKTVPPSPNSGPGKGRADSLEAAKSLAEKQLDGFLLDFDDFKKKYGIQE